MANDLQGANGWRNHVTSEDGGRCVVMTCDHLTDPDYPTATERARIAVGVALTHLSLFLRAVERGMWDYAQYHHRHRTTRLDEMCEELDIDARALTGEDLDEVPAWTQCCDDQREYRWAHRWLEWGEPDTLPSAIRLLREIREDLRRDGAHERAGELRYAISVLEELAE